MLDAESIFIYKAIKRCKPDLQIMVELVSQQNIDFLMRKDFKRYVKFDYDKTPLFAAGEIYISLIIDTLTC